MTEIEVICAGLAMTTERLEGMLKDLNYKIYKETKEKDIDKWLKIHKNTESENDYEEIMAIKGLLEGYTASIGHPSNGFAVELLELYPNAKVILTVDENSESWDDKVSKKDGFFDTIYKSGFSCSGRSLKKLQKASMERCAVYGFHTDIPENREQFYDDWNNFIRAKIPKEKLLIFNPTTNLQELQSFLEQ